MLHLGETPDSPCVERGTRTKPTLHLGSPVRTVVEVRHIMAMMHGPKSIEGRSVEHACDNELCVRYDHLRLGTQATNMWDKELKGRGAAWNRDKTHCKRNHEFTDENTYVEPSGKRQCRACRRLNDHKRGRTPGKTLNT